MSNNPRLNKQINAFQNHETGTHYNINRDYNPVTGRYIQSDPIGFDGGVNGFGYGENRPLIATDPLGKFIIFIGGAADDITNIVESYAYKHHRKTSAYFEHWRWNSSIKAVIDKVHKHNPYEPIAMVGHSFGGDTATEFVQQYPGVVDYLLTVDPVGWWMPSRSDLQIRDWHNIDATPSNPNFSDTIASWGNEWGSAVDGQSDSYTTVDTNHGSFATMMYYGSPALGYYDTGRSNNWGELGSGYWDPTLN